MANFFQLFHDATLRFPERTAIEVIRQSSAEAWTYAQLGEDADRWATWLVAQGVTPGDRCAILADNDARWIGAYFGVLRIGAVAVPLDTNYKSTQVRTVVENCGARVVFTTAKFRETVDAAAPNALRVDLYADAAGRPAGPTPPVAPRGADDAAVLLYTSGTTSDPKGVILSHGNLEAERASAFKIVRLTEQDAVLGVLPLFHALAQLANLLLPLIVGGRVVFLEQVSSSALLSALQQKQISIFACVPQFFYLIHQRVTAEVGKRGALGQRLFRTMLRTNGWLRDTFGWNPGKRWFSRVHHTLGRHMRVLITGGSKFDPVIGRQLFEMGFTLQNAYGLTECTGGATIMRPDDKYNTSVGQAIDGVEIRIAPRDTANADTDGPQDGEILLRGPIVMQGYFNRPDATAAVLKDGWFSTGDLGYLDADGRLYITGRKKEIIVLSSGKNLYPEEIEAHYRQSPLIKELCILGLSKPGEPSAERLHGVIVPDEQVMQERGITNVRELIRFDVEGLSATLPAHKRVLTYDVWFEPLPRTSTGKVKRHEVERLVRDRADAVAAAGAAHEARPLSEDERAWLSDPDRSDALSALAERLNRPTIRPDANLELDLTLDSMERVEILTMLEQRAGTRVTPDVRATIFTVRQLIDAVMSAGGGRGTGAATQEPWETILAQKPAGAVAEDLQRDQPLVALLFFVPLKVIGWLARVVLRFRVSGLEHLPANGPFILCPNHQSYLDSFFVLSALPFRVFRQLFFVGASEYFETPRMKAFARLTHIIPVDPNENLMSAMQAGATGLRLNKVLVLFPEGERSIDGELKPFRKGAPILSAQLGVPIVPVAMDGLFQLWPRTKSLQWRAMLPWNLTPVRVQFGAPLQMSKGDDAGATASLRRAIEDMFNAMRTSSAARRA
jgi:long-chain acyl-CoA synthetase